MIIDAYLFITLVTATGIAVWFVGFTRQEKREPLLLSDKTPPQTHTSRIWNMLKNNELID